MSPRDAKVAIDRTVGLYRQPNEWTCGPFALKHALVTLGRLTHERDIAQIANPHRYFGTDEIRLARAAKAYDCELPVIRRREERTALASLVSYVSRRIPVILCIDDWGHWVTVVRHEKKKFVVMDSKQDRVVTVVGWSHLHRRWSYTDQGSYPKPMYDLLPVKPLFSPPARANFSVERVQFLRRNENRDLAKHWDEYLEDLMEICGTGRRGQAGQSMGRFLRRHSSTLCDRVSYWHGDVPRDQVNRVVRNFAFVADTYGLSLSTSNKSRALMDVSMLLAMWASAAKGITPFYGGES